MFFESTNANIICRRHNFCYLASSVISNLFQFFSASPQSSSGVDLRDSCLATQTVFPWLKQDKDSHVVRAGSPGTEGFTMPSDQSPLPSSPLKGEDSSGLKPWMKMMSGRGSQISTEKLSHVISQAWEASIGGRIASSLVCTPPT